MTYNQSSSSQFFSPNESNHFTYNYTSPTNKKAQVVLFGPMIGKVTHNTARILIEFSVDRDFTCTLQPASGGWKTCTRRCKARVPQVFTFEGLKPKTFYNVFFDCELPVLSSFWTLRENNDNPGVLNVAVMSCNEISHQEEKVQQGKDQWVGLGERVARHELDYIFHIGDQVYMDMGKNEKDCPYQRIHSILKKIPQSCWEAEKPRLLEMLREQYRKTWAQYKSIAYVLANVPNLTICDDHEFRDDWGYLDEDHEKGTIDNYYGQLARQVYYEYQRQLREDIPWNNLASLKCEYYYEILHNVGISFMEYRGCRSWFRESRLKETHMGANQLKWIESLYKPGGAFDNLKATLFISPVPLYFLSHNMSKVARLQGDDVQEEFTYDSISQLKHLLDLLRNWKGRNTHRQIALIGGDVHMGGFTKIYYKGEWILTQMVSSAINGKAITNTEKKVIDVLQHIGNKSGDYKFEQKGWVKENNYGLIEVRDDNSFSSMKLNLVRSAFV